MTSKPDHHSIKAIFEAARDKTCGTEREDCLRRMVGDDETLRARVERMLAAVESSSPYRLNLVVAELGRNRRSCRCVLQPKSADARVGPYHLVYKLAEGGMGEVFVAEQRQPIRRTVALKLIKRGMDSREVLARFDAERQALALMDHPNVGRVLDAGETDDGRPYFVMDLVRGLPITDYCDQHKLSTTSETNCSPVSAWPFSMPIRRESFIAI